METVCDIYEKGICSLSIFLSDSDNLRNFLILHKLVPEKKCPKCQTELVINSENTQCFSYSKVGVDQQ